MTKTPTQEFTFNDFWNRFKNDYLPFVEWVQDASDENTSFINVVFLEDVPTEYVNKWGRTQYKIKVKQKADEAFLSAGKKLFQRLRDVCLQFKEQPTQLGMLRIERYGSGFETDYSIKKLPGTPTKN